MAQIDRLKVRIGISEDAENNALNEYLETAKSAILKRRYPFVTYPKDDSGNILLDSRYEDTQLNIAEYLYNKRGAEGETAHSENGISRSYENAGIPESYLTDVKPLVG